MGTRHRQSVVTKEGDLKIQQYGQWDGYPSGQGVEILEFLKGADLSAFQTALVPISVATDEQIKHVSEDLNWKNNHPYLSRDCGSDIYKLIQSGSVLFVQHIEEDEARKWCEGFYEINFKTNKFTSEYYGVIKSYDLDKLPTEDQYLKDMGVSSDEEE